MKWGRFKFSSQPLQIICELNEFMHSLALSILCKHGVT